MAKKGVKKKGVSKKEGKKKRKRIAWKNIRVPEELHSWLKRNSTIQEKAMHKVIRDLILERGKQLRDIDKLTWYSFKLINGYAMWKQTYSIVSSLPEKEQKRFYGVEKAQREKLLNTIEQIEARLNIDLSDLREMIDNVNDKLTGKEISKLNDAFKRAMEKILMKLAE